MNILNGQDAFAALSAGQKIEARHVQSGEFDSLDNFPATVFINPEYEFRIAITYITIGEMQVPEPAKEAPAKGFQCFAPSMLTEDLSKTFKWKNSDLDLALLQRGQVHLEQEHAVTHALALIAVSGGSVETETKGKTIYGSNVDSQEVFSTYKSSIANTILVETIAGITNQIKVNTLLNNDQIMELIQFADDHLKTLITKNDKPVANPNEAIKSAESEVIETDTVKLIEKFTLQINECTTTQTVLDLRPIFMANGHLDREHHQHLCKLTEDKLLELDPEQYTPKVLPPSDNLSVDELKRLQQEAEKLIHPDSTEQTVQIDEDEVYKTLLTDLLERVAKSISPAEANAQIKYTRSWTEEQRKPLIEAINKRLVELNPPKTQSSLAVRIQKAEDLTELDALEIDVSACDEEIQPRLMEMVEKRRLELDPFAAAIGDAS